jgi:hypothetical protein
MICDKTSYTTRSEAVTAIKGMKKTIRNKKHSYHAYKCNDCGGFHITTAGKGFRPQNNQRKRESKYPFRYEPVVKNIKSKKKK